MYQFPSKFTMPIKSNKERDYNLTYRPRNPLQKSRRISNLIKNRVMIIITVQNNPLEKSKRLSNPIK